jgi:hypothetical protein
MCFPFSNIHWCNLVNANKSSSTPKVWIYHHVTCMIYSSTSTGTKLSRPCSSSTIALFLINKREEIIIKSTICSIIVTSHWLEWTSYFLWEKHISNIMTFNPLLLQHLLLMFTYLYKNRSSLSILRIHD